MDGPGIDPGYSGIILDPPLPTNVRLSRGTALLVHGWFNAGTSRIRRVKVTVNREAYTADFQHANDWPRFGTESAEIAPTDPDTEFWAIVPVEAGEKTAELGAEITPVKGQPVRCGLGQIEVQASKYPRASSDDSNRFARARIAICMTTYEPPIRLFARQVESIRSQTFGDWICFISDDYSTDDTIQRMAEVMEDDPRFVLVQHKERLGFYRNFERCLALVPESAEFIALSDHDDCWHPDKLQRLLDEFDDTTQLVYSDMNIVDEDFRVLSKTYWTTRRNNYERLDYLLCANTITGAASMFRRSMLDVLLPFPQEIGDAYHDHWIGVVALACGNIRYIDEPLYDYVQHRNNVLGHFVPQQRSPLEAAVSWLGETMKVIENGGPDVSSWRTIYFNEVLRLRLMASILLTRSGDSIDGRKAQVLRRFAALGVSASPFFWLSGRAISNLAGAPFTLGSENRLIRGALWNRFLRRSRGGAQRLAETATAPRIDLRLTATADFLKQKTAPVALSVSDRAPRRVNIIIPTVDVNIFFGGYIAKFNLARKLAEDGQKVRIVIVDSCDFRPQKWREALKGFDGLGTFLDLVEFAYVFDRSKLLEVNPRDTFIATTWWTAHIAHLASRGLGRSFFLYLIQEYEPFTFPMGSMYALAKESYSWPHKAIFSTELLRDFFRQKRIGVFQSQSGEEDSVSFQNALTRVVCPSTNALASRKARKLLFYARPEPHAARNMFDMGLMALNEAISSGAFPNEWEFFGIGAAQQMSQVPLSDGRPLTLLPRRDQSDYAKALPQFDLGLSLMYTPHPSLVPLEMASAGMVVVTNTYANKTEERLEEISRNIIASPPTITGIAGKLAEAVSRTDEFQDRVANSSVKWSRDWDTAFSRDVLDAIQGFINDSVKGSS